MVDRGVASWIAAAVLYGLMWSSPAMAGFDEHVGAPGFSEVIEDPSPLATDGFPSDAAAMPADAVVDAPEGDPSLDLSPAVGFQNVSVARPKALFLSVQPRWQAQIDALMLWQGNIPSRVLYTEWPSGAPALDVNQAQTEMAAGVRYGLLLNLDPIYALEGTYLNVGSFTGAAETPTGVYAQNNLAAPSIGPAQGILFSSGEVITSGTVSGAELNWRRRTCSPITWLAGFRWLEWNQGMLVRDRFAFDPMVGEPPGSSTLDVATGNSLYGGQLGLDLCLWNRRAGAIQVNGVGKAGVFYNHASFQRTTGAFLQEGRSPIALGPVSATADQTSFVGELGVNADLRITEWLSWRAGYTLFWLSCVATPSDQLSVMNIADRPPTASINTNGSVLLHGVTTGLEARW